MKRGKGEYEKDLRRASQQQKKQAKWKEQTECRMQYNSY